MSGKSLSDGSVLLLLFQYLYVYIKLFNLSFDSRFVFRTDVRSDDMGVCQLYFLLNVN